MTQTDANKIRDRVDELNKLYPIKLRYQFIETGALMGAVTIVYNYTPDEWMEFCSFEFNCNKILDKLSGFQFAMEAILAYQEECGNIKIQNFESK